MGIERHKLYWRIRQSNFIPYPDDDNDDNPNEVDCGGYSEDWRDFWYENPNKLPLNLCVWYKNIKVLEICEKETFFHAMNIGASSLGNTVEFAFFGYFDGDKARYLIIQEDGTLLESSWFEDEASRFLPFRMENGEETV